MLYCFCTAPVQVSSVQSSLETAFQHAERHKRLFEPHQRMALEDAELDIPGLAEAFKAKEAEAAAAAADASGGGSGELPHPHVVNDGGDGAPREGEEEEEEEAAGPAPVTLSTFRHLLDTLSEQRVAMEALPAHSDVHVIRVDLVELKVGGWGGEQRFGCLAAR